MTKFFIMICDDIACCLVIQILFGYFKAFSSLVGVPVFLLTVALVLDKYTSPQKILTVLIGKFVCVFVVLVLFLFTSFFHMRVFFAFSLFFNIYSFMILSKYLQHLNTTTTIIILPFIALVTCCYGAYLRQE